MASRGAPPSIGERLERKPLVKLLVIVGAGLVAAAVLVAIGVVWVRASTVKDVESIKREARAERVEAEAQGSGFTATSLSFAERRARAEASAEAGGEKPTPPPVPTAVVGAQRTPAPAAPPEPEVAAPPAQETHFGKPDHTVGSSNRVVTVELGPVDTENVQREREEWEKEDNAPVPEDLEGYEPEQPVGEDAPPL